MIPKPDGLIHPWSLQQHKVLAPGRMQLKIWVGVGVKKDHS